jgi:hypothetical protein
MPSVDINWLAVAVAAVVTFLIGGLWYSPILFGKLWTRLHGYTDQQLEAMKQGAGKAYGLSFVAYLVMAGVMAVLVDWTGAAGAAEGACLGSTVWLGFAATIGLTATLFSNRSLGTWLLDAGYQLVYLVAQGIILAVWP